MRVGVVAHRPLRRARSTVHLVDSDEPPSPPPTRALAGATGISPVVQTLAASNVVSFNTPNLPTYVRVTPAGRPDALYVTWQSMSDAGQRVRWGAVAGTFTNVAAATSKTFTADDMCTTGPAATVGFLRPGWINTALVTGLAQYSGQTLYYQVGSPDAGGVWSATYALNVPPAPVRGGAVATTLLISADNGAQPCAALGSAGRLRHPAGRRYRSGS